MSRALWPNLMPADRQGRADLCAVSAAGHMITFEDGVERLCATSGLWNVNLGYGNEAIALACGQALRDASYLGVFRYENRYAREASELLVDVAGAQHFERVLFSTSGGAANDLTMKLVRHTQLLRGAPQRRLVAGLAGSYHGLTYGALALTGDELGQQAYGADRRLIRQTTPNDTAALRSLLERNGSQLAAVVVEPVLGSGAVPLTTEFVQALIDGRREYGYLLVADEVATGFARTGPWFASQSWPEPPDVLLASKGLTNGTMPAAAVIVSAEVSREFDRSETMLLHAETQAGTAVTAAAVIATVAEMRRLNVPARAEWLGRQLDRRLADWVAAEPRIGSTSGAGAFRAVQVVDDAGEPISPVVVPELIDAIRAAGAVVHPGPNGFQLIPALTYRAEDLDELMDKVQTGLAAFARQTREVAA